MNPGYTEEVKNSILNNAKELDIPIQMFDSDIFDVIESAACFWDVNGTGHPATTEITLADRVGQFHPTQIEPIIMEAWHQRLGVGHPCAIRLFLKPA